MLKIHLDNLHNFEHNEVELEKAESRYLDLVNSPEGGFQRILNSSDQDHPNFDEILEVAKRYSNKKTAITDFVVVGMGGSSLGAKTLLSALSKSNIRFHYLDNNDPDFVSRVLQSLKPEGSLFYVVSKSGGTLETITITLTIMSWFKEKSINYSDNFIFCIEKNASDLRKFATKLGAYIFDHPKSIGGRFSVFTVVGLFPAAFANIDIRQLFTGAKNASNTLLGSDNVVSKCAYYISKHRFDFPNTICFTYSSKLKSATKWFAQIWAESLGKEGIGFTPYPAIGCTDQHGQMQLYIEGPKDKLVQFVQVQKFSNSKNLSLPKECEGLKSFDSLKNKSMASLFNASLNGTRDALTEIKIPNFTVIIDEVDTDSVGALLFFWQALTVYTAAYLNINPFNQPGVELSKRLAKKYIEFIE